MLNCSSNILQFGIITSTYTDVNKHIHTCGDVLSVRTISSSGMTCAGLKKWAPTIRSGHEVFAPMRVRSMVEVLDDRMASGLHARSRSAKI